MSLLPYPGLRPFYRDEVDIFFGRDEQVEQLAAKLRKSRFLAVVGPSGCGKSSLIYTGLLNAVEAGFLTDIGLHWRIAILNPGRHPMENLAAALINQAGVWSAPRSSNDNTNAAESVADASTNLPKSDENSPGQPDNDRTAPLLANLRRGPLGLIEALREQPLPASHNLLIVVDQFEEIFRYRQHQNRDEADAFVALLLRSISESEIPVYVVITMRSDFLGDCALFPGLPEALNDSQFLTPRLTREQRRLAITGPAKVFGGEIEPTLVNRLLNDMGTDPDQLPVLQHALMRLWTIAAKRGDQPTLLTLHDYEALGGWDKTLSNHADQIYDTLTATQQSIAKILFQSLSERSAAKRDIRHPTKLKAIAEIAEVSIDQVIPIIDAFRHSDCSFLRSSEDQLTSETVIDISHESLIRQWERMKEWIKEEAESVEIYRELEQNARQYEEGRGGLLEGLDLLPVIAWKKKKQPNSTWAARYGEDFDRAMHFLARSERQRTINFIWGTLGVIVVVIVLWWMLQLWLEAKVASEVAEIAQKSADSNRKAAEELNEKAKTASTDATNRRMFAKSQYLRNQSASYYHLSTLIGIQVLRDSLPPQDSQHSDINPDPPKDQKSSQDLDPRKDWIARHSRHSDTIWDTAARWVEQRSQSLDSAFKHSAQVPAADSKAAETSRYFDASYNQFLRDSQDLLPKQVHTLQHNSDVKQVVYSPGGKYLATASDDNNVRLWDVTDLTNVASDKKLPILKQVLKHDKSVSAVAFSPNGKLLATASEDNITRLWDVNSGEKLRTLKHDGYVRNAVFSGDGKYLATAGDDNTARLWNVASGKELQRLRHDGSVRSVTFSSDGKLLATASDDNTARLWNVASGKELQRLRHSGAVRSVAFSHDGKRLATASRDKTARLWSVASGKELQRLNHNDYIQAIAFSHDGKRFATASEDNIARLWDVASGKELLHLHHDDHVTDVTFSPDDKRLATASRDRTARLWSVASGKELQRMPHNGIVRSVTFSPGENGKSKYLATASDDDTARLWNVTSDKKVLYILNHDEFVSAVAFSSDGKLLATASGDRTARLWNVDSGEELWHMHHKDSVSAVAFSPDGKLLATASDDKTARLWDISDLKNDDEKAVNEDKTARSWDASSKQLRSLPHSSAVKNVVFNHDGKLLVTTSNDKAARLWNVASGEKLRTLEHDDFVRTAIFSPDEHSKYLATASDDNTAGLWDVNSGKRLQTLKHEKFVSSVAFSPDGKLLATTSDDTTARLWDVPSGKRLPTPEHVLKHGDYVRTAAFSSDGKLLATASDDNIVRLWNVDLGEKDFGKELNRLPHDSYVPVAIFSPDESSKYLATADDKIARVWDVTSGEELQRLSHGDSIIDMAFSPNGKSLATASEDKAARLWLWQSEEEENKDELIKKLDQLCASMTSNLSWEQWQQYFGDKPYRRTCPDLLPLDVKQIAKQYRLLASQEGDKAKANKMLKELSEAYKDLNLWKEIKQ